MRLAVEEMLEAIEGWPAIVEWFGQSPRFHDCEIVKTELLRDPSRVEIAIKAWRTSATELDAAGYYLRDRHAVVKICVTQVIRLDLSEWNNQNVVSGIDFDRNSEGIAMTIDSSYGLCGSVVGRTISATVVPIK